MENFSRSGDPLIGQREKQLLRDAVEAAESLARSLESLKLTLSRHCGRTADDLIRLERQCMSKRKS
jgi:hypothetical protein